MTLGKGQGQVPVAGLARDQVDRVHRRRTEIGAERIVVHRVVLRVIPQCRYGIAVVIAHNGRAVLGAAGAGS